MITTKYNFRQWLKKKYPDIIPTPVYGTSAYILNKALEPIDMYQYNVQQLANGRYIVFIGVNYSEQYIRELMSNINNGTLQQSKRPPAPFAPTTFSAFEHYLEQKGIEPIHRTHIQDQTANEALFTESDEPGWNSRRNWYMYELEKGSIELNPASPYRETENNTIVVLIKCATSSYVSKKKLFAQKFVLMQPLYEQLVASLATADDNRAVELCNQYVSIQFDQELKVKNIEDMKEAYKDGLLRMYTCKVENFEVASDDETL